MRLKRLFETQSHQEPGSAPSLGPRRLAEHVKSLRLDRGWTLEQAAEQIGLSRSAISKIEREEMSPTFSALQKLAQGFGLGLVELLGNERMDLPTGRRSVSRAGEGRVQELPNYQLRLLLSDLKRTAFVPYEVIVRGRHLSEFEQWDRHDSEDFVYVLDGRIELFTELYEPVVLDRGDSVFFDAQMGHVLISLSEQDARLLCISAMRE